MKKTIIVILNVLLIGNFIKAQLPNDSPAAREAAIARLQKSSSCKVCDDDAALFMPYGTSCNSREFQAPAILAAPKKKWEINPGWWGVWTPVPIGNIILTGSCNNDGNEGLSAIDKTTGKTVWRIGDICSMGNRRGSMGIITIFQLNATEVLMIYPREDGTPTDYFVINIKTGKIVRNLKPIQQGPLRYKGGFFTTINQNSKDGFSTITALSNDLSNILWKNNEFKLAMPDKLNPLYVPTFSAPASWHGIQFITARSSQQSEPYTRQLHAIDMKTGKTIWKHSEQPIMQKWNGRTYLSDDGIPMIADDKVIIRVQSMSFPNTYTTGLRALDPTTGKIIWTTAPQPGISLFARVVACKMLISEVELNNKKELWGYNLADGSVAWQRPISNNARLMASSGGVFYVGERILDADNHYKDHVLQGFDGLTGTLLWTGSYPDYYFGLGTNSTGWDIEDKNASTPVWTIDKDGAIYGVTLKGLFKLK